MTADRQESALQRSIETLPALSALLSEAAAIPGIATQRLDLLRNKVRDHAFNLVVCGEFKRGKSSLINALLGAELLPTGVVPLTSVVTVLVHAEAADAEVVFDGGDRRRVSLDALSDYVTEPGNPGNTKGVHEVVVGCPAPWLAGGLRLVDTPGIGSVHQQNTEVTRRYLPQADAVIFVGSVDQPLSRHELDFLTEIRSHAGRVFCLLNKIDHLTDAELAESTAFATRVLRDALGEDVPVFPVSARPAMQGRQLNDTALFERSRLPAFDTALRNFLARDRGQVWAQSIGRQLLRLIDEARLAAQFEQAALATPLALLDKRLDAFAVKKLETLHARDGFDALLEAESRKLVRERIEPDLAAFRTSLVPRLNALLNNWYDELRPRGSAALQAGLEDRMVDEVRRAFDAWRTEEDESLRAAFDHLCVRLSARVQQIIDELLTFSAGLFDLPFSAHPADSPWRMPAGFRYKFWDMPPSLLLVRNALVLALPGMVGHPIILHDAQRRAADLTTTQAGRLSYDFQERIKANVQAFRRETTERIGGTLVGIESAIDKGKALRLQGERSASERSADLAATLDRLQDLSDRVSQMA